MSRIGKNPVTVPQGVTVEVKGQDVIVAGKLGRKSLTLHREVSAAVKDGKVVFEKAVKLMTLCSEQALGRAGIKASQIDYFIPHQANARIFDLVAENLDIDPCRTLRSIEEFGNSSAATIPLTLSLASEQGKFADGLLLLMAAVGAGFTGGAVVFRTSDQ